MRGHAALNVTKGDIPPIRNATIRNAKRRFSEQPVASCACQKLVISALFDDSMAEEMADSLSETY
jgi:hypothetical protein